MQEVPAGVLVEDGHRVVYLQHTCMHVNVHVNLALDKNCIVHIQNGIHVNAHVHNSVHDQCMQRTVYLHFCYNVHAHS